jgi:transcriptional regulator GlxA family with amidase domain
MTDFSILPAGMAPKRIGFVGFDGVATLDLTGPFEALATARIQEDQRKGQPCYNVMMLGLTSKTFVSESGVVFKAQKTIRTAPPLDTIVIPGGRGLREPETNRGVSAWLSTQAERTRRIVSVSTGVYAPAQSGLLDGRHVTTHWRFYRDLAQRFPKLCVNYTASFLKDECFYTCGGGTAGIEMMLALINEDFGARTALTVARELVMRLRPPGDDESQIDLSLDQSEPTERLADLPSWILANLHGNLSVEILAERTFVCPRHFSRLFKQVFNSTPADFVEQLRLSEARRRLLTPRNSVESVAESVGFKSADAFRRAFERRLGVSPSHFRSRFQFRAKNVIVKRDTSRTLIFPLRKVRSN